MDELKELTKKVDELYERISRLEKHIHFIHTAPDHTDLPAYPEVEPTKEEEKEDYIEWVRWFPILLTGSLRRTPNIRTIVEWDFVWPHRMQAMKNHTQTLERLAERGGLSFSELLAVLEDRPYSQIDEEEAMWKVEELLLEWKESR